ncbi:hypothetical protein DPMN_155991 [Dreissena polymorpha]|uniref:Uncharacterized protein n=1 Tax=Dreissena polymorpha TaxID=45954 RepID=A0A9D4FSR3_DREPO|nr:hypothetical protein DPMN_155991 [Dreissena polymorpha]
MMPVGTTGINRGSTGRVLKCLITPGVTGKDRHREQPDGTVVPPGPIKTPAELRQRTGCRRWCPGECRQSPVIATVHR